MKLSIITINLNNRDGLQKTIQSVVSQTGVAVEFIVVDGGSVDGSVDLIKNSPSVTKYVSEKDSGVYGAQNKGIDMATGNYLLFLNSGDYLYESDTLSRVFPFLDGKTGIVYGNLMIEEKDGIRPGYMPEKIDLTQMMEDTLWHPVSFISASLFAQYGKYEETYRICGDYDFFFRVIIRHKVTTRHCGHFISVFQHNGLSAQPANVPIILKEKDIIQKKYLGGNGVRAYHRKKKFSYYLKRLFKWFR